MASLSKTISLGDSTTPPVLGDTSLFESASFCSSDIDSMSAFFCSASFACRAALALFICSSTSLSLAPSSCFAGDCIFWTASPFGDPAAEPGFSPASASTAPLSSGCLSSATFFASSLSAAAAAALSKAGIARPAERESFFTARLAGAAVELRVRRSTLSCTSFFLSSSSAASSRAIIIWLFSCCSFSSISRLIVSLTASLPCSATSRGVLPAMFLLSSAELWE
mmetsp:Transcript_11555/g.46726  ORF Transcript_11555/g.46726 Transcript_11555/m.46726 type:complete len:224 (-) Transcript_11555:794-1465(-)